MTTELHRLIRDFLAHWGIQHIPEVSSARKHSTSAVVVISGTRYKGNPRERGEVGSIMNNALT